MSEIEKSFLMDLWPRKFGNLMGTEDISSTPFFKHGKIICFQFHAF
jgi:hypothetical protein